MLWRIRGLATKTPMWIKGDPGKSLTEGRDWTTHPEDAATWTDEEKAKISLNECFGSTRDNVKWELVPGQYGIDKEVKCDCEVCRRKIVSLSETEKETTT